MVFKGHGQEFGNKAILMRSFSDSMRRLLRYRSQ
jgi:hypothetical protein